MPMIRMRGVYKTYANGVHALKNVSVDIEPGEFVYVVGPSGAGKTTFIKLMYSEERPSKGEVHVNSINLSDLKNRDKPKLRRSLGVVFQDFKLLPRLTAFENVAFAMEVTEKPKREIKKIVMEVLDLVRLKQKARSYPHELSGGEQQRISIARALVNKPGLVIADEPTGNLDPDTSWGIMELFETINHLGTTIVMATHNKDIVNNMKKRVIAMEHGEIVRDQLRGEYGYED